jgi:hypothetical protein
MRGRELTDFVSWKVREARGTLADGLDLLLGQFTGNSGGRVRNVQGRSDEHGQRRGELSADGSMLLW